MLLDANADPNIPNDEFQTPLSWAAAEGGEETLELLLKQPPIALEIADKLGQTPLSRASSNRHTKCVRALLAKGANVEATDKEGQTALSLAAMNGHRVVAKLLLKNKAHINVQDQKGNTPLALAFENNHDAVVRFLLESGADPDLPDEDEDEDEENPFEKARDRHMDQIVRVFRKYVFRKGLKLQTRERSRLELHSTCFAGTSGIIRHAITDYRKEDGRRRACLISRTLSSSFLP